MELSIVATLYRSAPHLDEFYRRIKAEAARITPDHEIILVNDGSPDDSLERALALCRKDSRVCVVDLSRNFGHHRAIMTGLSYAKGGKVFLIDCDLEEEPELLGRFHGRFREGGCDVVYGVQERRKGAVLERISGSLFYTLLNSLSDCEFPRNVLVARLMSRRYVRSLIEHQERELYLAGLWHITGYDQVAILARKRSKGDTTYTLGKKLIVALNSITSFSDKPLVYIFYLGTAISGVSIPWMMHILYRKFVHGVSVDGWTSLVVSIWFLGGLSIFSLGIIGIYLSKVFIEVKRRPYSIVRAVYRDGRTGASDAARNLRGSLLPAEDCGET